MSVGGGKNVALWVVTILLAAAFAFSGGGKLAGLPMYAKSFAAWGYPPWFQYFTGAIELGSALLLLVPRTTFYGALLLVATMIGAVLTHLTHHQAARVPAPAVLLVLAGIVAFGRRPSARASGASGSTLAA